MEELFDWVIEQDLADDQWRHRDAAVVNGSRTRKAVDIWAFGVTKL